MVVNRCTRTPLFGAEGLDHNIDPAQLELLEVYGGGVRVDDGHLLVQTDHLSGRIGTVRHLLDGRVEKADLAPETESQALGLSTADVVPSEFRSLGHWPKWPVEVDFDNMLPPSFHEYAGVCRHGQREPKHAQTGGPAIGHSGSEGSRID